MKCTDDKCFHIDFCNDLESCPNFGSVEECRFFREEGGSKKLNITREDQERQYRNWNFSDQRGEYGGYYGQS